MVRTNSVESIGLEHGIGLRDAKRMLAEKLTNEHETDELFRL